MTRPAQRGEMKGYTPLDWKEPSELSPSERAAVEVMRRDLWRNGVRTEPLLTRMAFEFAAVATMQKAAKKHGIKT
jgi:hypothetical protein